MNSAIDLIRYSQVMNFGLNLDKIGSGMFAFILLFTACVKFDRLLLFGFSAML